MPNPVIQTNIRIPPDLHEWLVKLAANRKMSLNAFIISLLRHTTGLPEKAKEESK